MSARATQHGKGDLPRRRRTVDQSFESLKPVGGQKSGQSAEHIDYTRPHLPSSTSLPFRCQSTRRSWRSPSMIRTAYETVSERRGPGRGIGTRQISRSESRMIRSQRHRARGPVLESIPNISARWTMKNKRDIPRVTRPKHRQ
jgi:hypothetical protein